MVKNIYFFKLEEHDMNNIHHLIKLLDLKRNDLYDKRRENEKYNDDLLKKDTEFYDNILIFFHFNRDDILKNINIYNDNLRTGCELFIFEELKEFFLSLSLDDIDII